jgi:hypothetical protein
MQESSVYKHLVETADEERYQRGLQHGAELGARQNALEFLFGVLEYKFDSNAVRLLLPPLENISDVNVLRQLLDAALRAQSLEAFVQNLETSRN